MCLCIYTCVFTYTYMCVYVYMYMLLFYEKNPTQTEAQAIFLNPFTICSLC